MTDVERRYHGADIILVGNKCDLKEKRVVTTLMGQVSNKITTFIYLTKESYSSYYGGREV